MKRLTSDKKMLEYELMKAHSNISCFSTTRHGGHSEGNYASFNCHEYGGDTPEHVAANRELLCSLLPQRPLEFVFPRQTHSVNVQVIDTIYIGTRAKERKALVEGVDALVSDIPGYCLCVSTADCIPVLLYDSINRAIGVVHAGWRGTVGRIVERTLAVMAERYGSEGKHISACIGPGISLNAFEVGEEVYEAFRDAGFAMEHIARRNELTQKWHLDLWEANRQQLLSFGVEQIEVAGICTYENKDDFFSARRLSIHSGRIVSGIMLHQ